MGHTIYSRFYRLILRRPKLQSKPHRGAQLTAQLTELSALVLPQSFCAFPELLCVPRASVLSFSFCAFPELLCFPKAFVLFHSFCAFSELLCCQAFAYITLTSRNKINQFYKCLLFVHSLHYPQCGACTIPISYRGASTIPISYREASTIPIS